MKTEPGPEPKSAVISVPDIRDYERINAELIQSLDLGVEHIRLAGVEKQRFLAAGLRGNWHAVIEVEGHAGPELAAGLEAPHLTVVCRGNVGDGAGRALVAGQLLILGSASEGLAYGQVGGTIVLVGSAGARAGLNQRGGTLLVLGPVGPLAGERQSGGVFYAYHDRIGPHSGHARRAGRFIVVPSDVATAAEASLPTDPDDLLGFQRTLERFRFWLGSSQEDPLQGTTERDN